MNEPEKKNEWLSPSTLFGFLGMLGAIFGTYVSLDGRLARVEERTTRLDRLEVKLDRLIEQRVAAR